MAYPEYRNSIPTQDALREWLSNGMTDGPLSSSLIPQVAPNRHINDYRIETKDGIFFVKVYLDTPEVAEREVKNFQYFKGLPFIPELRHYIFPDESQQRLIAYEFITGEDLHRQFTAARQVGEYLDPSIMLEAVTQISQMREAVGAYKPVLPVKTPWALKSPIRRGFVSEEVEGQFVADYSAVLAQNTRTVGLFPGFYFDRNPRNLMHNERGVYQVDFGVIEQSSPLFDLVKLFRNGTDILLDESVDLKTLSPDSLLIERISTYPLGQEYMFLRHAYDDYVQKNRVTAEATFENFMLGYEYAATHSHFFYMTKYLFMLKHNTGEQAKLTSRCIYHIGLLRKTLEKLSKRGEPISPLSRWVNCFVENAST